MEATAESIAKIVETVKQTLEKTPPELAADIKEIAEIFVDKQYAGKTIEEIEDDDQATIYLILRDDLSILPQKDTVLKLNDIIVVRSTEET